MEIKSVDQDYIKARIAGGSDDHTYLLRTRLLVATLMALASCSVERGEVKRVVSPDHETVAVLVREHVAGGVGDMKSYVYLVKTYGEQELSRPNVIIDSCGGISPVWKDNTTLHLEYDPAC